MNWRVVGISVGVALLVVAAAAPSIYFFRRYQEAQSRLANPAMSSEVETRQTIEAVKKLIMVPEGETPTIAVVTDVTKLLDQPFFANAKNQDKVLIFTKAKKAILYRPSTNKIIEVGPITIGEPTPTQSTLEEPSVSPSATSAADKSQ